MSGKFLFQVLHSLIHLLDVGKSDCCLDVVKPHKRKKENLSVRVISLMPISSVLFMPSLSKTCVVFVYNVDLL